MLSCCLSPLEPVKHKCHRCPQCPPPAVSPPTQASFTANLTSASIPLHKERLPGWFPAPKTKNVLPSLHPAPVKAHKAPLPHSEPPPKRHQAAQPAPAPASPRLPGNPVWVKTEKEKKKPNVSGVAQTDFLALGFSSHALINISLPCCLGRGHQEARSHSLSHTYPTHSPNIKRC